MVVVTLATANTKSANNYFTAELQGWEQYEFFANRENTNMSTHVSSSHQHKLYMQ